MPVLPPDEEPEEDEDERKGANTHFRYTINH